jgi:hypothetical protein
MKRTVCPTTLILAAMVFTSVLHAGSPDEATSTKTNTKGPPLYRSGTGEAERLASKLREFMLKYDSAVQSKAGAEEKFYLDQQDALRNFWLPGEILSKDKNTRDQIIQRSIPYLFITDRAHRSSLEIAEGLAINPDNTHPLQTVLSYLDTSLQEDEELFTKAQSEQQQLRLELGESLGKIDLQDSLRKNIRDSMLKLELPPSRTEELTQVYRLGVSAEQQFQQTRPEKKLTPAPSKKPTPTPQKKPTPTKP